MLTLLAFKGMGAPCTIKHAHTHQHINKDFTPTVTVLTLAGASALHTTNMRMLTTSSTTNMRMLTTSSILPQQCSAYRGRAREGVCSMQHESHGGVPQ
jgi:hypothetical protein